MTEDTEFHQALEEGRDQFNRGCFFEAHDTWEELWTGTRGPDRPFLEGLIHAAVGCYHVNDRNFRGARSQFRRALEALADAGEIRHGLDVAGLCRLLVEYRCRLSDPSTPELEGIPQPRLDRTE